MFVCFSKLQVFDGGKVLFAQLRKLWSFPDRQICHLRFDFSSLCVFKIQMQRRGCVKSVQIRKLWSFPDQHISHSSAKSVVAIL